MTEKEKAEAYDEAIVRAKKLYSNGIAEEIFHELKESEDDKIRKEIISILRNAYWTSNKNRFNELVAWLEKQRDKDKLIQDLGEYKVKYTQEILEKYVNNMINKDDERLRKTAIAFLKDFVEQGYENAVECIDWLEKQGEQASIQTNERAWLYLVSDVLTWKDGIGQYLDDPRVQELAKKLCSEYAKKLYNPWELVHDKKSKFDPKTLHPYDKVLVRRCNENYNIWFPDFVSNPPNNDNNKTLCMCIGDDIAMIIPYNNDTKHLIGTTDEAPEFYKYWED